MKILFTGGGTGGHIFPLIAVGREIKKSLAPQEKLTIYYLGPKDEIPDLLLTQEGIKVKRIFAGKIRRYFGFLPLLQNLIDIILKIPLGVLQTFFYVFLWNPSLIFSKGGYGSLPTVISGWILGIPIFLHESDTAPGLANRFLSRFCLEVFVSFPVQKTEFFTSQKMISVGNPVRLEVLEGSKTEADKFFRITQKKPVVLVLGGSQGSQRINDILLQILPDFLKNFELIHQTGGRNFKQAAGEAKAMVSKEQEKYYHPLGFFNEPELTLAYQAADLIVSRAGSGSIFEIAALGKPSILLPLPESAQNHQVKNAYAYAETEAALVIEQSNLTPYFFLDRIKYLFSRPEELAEMAQKAKNFSRPRAAKIIAEYILTYLQK